MKENRGTTKLNIARQKKWILKQKLKRSEKKREIH